MPRSCRAESAGTLARMEQKDVERKRQQAHKVAHIKDYLPKACPSAGSVILDAEILMVDKQGKMLPVRPSLGLADRPVWEQPTMS